MITSEVQRTLVKSPPELWTELSDPASLARHLGELGEIRITRTEPETLVEWEAEGTTGTVEITPSGWGTRVTLTVLRELAADLAEAEQASEPGTEATEWEPEPEPLDGADAVVSESVDAAGAADAVGMGSSKALDATDPVQTEAGDALDAGPAAAETPDAEQQPGAPEMAAAAEAGVYRGETHDAPEAESAREPETVPHGSGAERQDSLEPAAERKPAPATEAARRAAGWPRQTGPAIESDLRAAEAVDGPPAEPDGLEAWAAQSIEAAEPSQAGEQTATEPSSEAPRRGLLARLFGWRRGRAAEDETPAEPLAPPREAEIDQEAEEEIRAVSPEEPEDPEPRLEDEPVLAVDGGPHEDPRDAEPGEPGGIELTEPDLDAPSLQALGEPEPEPETPEAQLPGEAAEPEAVEQALAESEPAEAEPVGNVPGEAGVVDPATGTAQAPAEPEPSAAEPEETAPTPVQDLAAELRAAEEVAAEQVEAVLSAVLDRLGSAHHRPFSRS